MLSFSRICFAPSLLKLHPLLETATTIQTKVREGLPLADEFDLKVLRIGYDEHIVRRYLQQQQKQQEESNSAPFVECNNSNNNLFISYHQDLFAKSSYSVADDFNSNNNNNNANDCSPSPPSIPFHSIPACCSSKARIFKLLRNCRSRGARHASCAGVLRLPYSERMLRPGGSINGPMMMTIADAAMFAVSYAVCGQPLSVTTNLQINFFRKPMAGQELVAEARLLKGGKRLHVFEVDVLAVDPWVFDETTNGRRDGDAEDDEVEEDDEDALTLVSHATGTYSIPVK